MSRRPGLSLTEVLVALFIMGIGTIAILTLFPLGALNMAQALRDDRTTQCATQAGAYLRWYWKSQSDKGQLTSEPFYQALDDPAPPALPTPPSTAGSFVIPVPVGSTGPSYPVVIDPMGFVSRPSGGSSQLFVGDDGRGDASNAKTPNQTNLARRNMNQVTSSSDPNKFALRTCTLLDGYGYNGGVPVKTGPPDKMGVPTGPVDRDMRYNWLWVIQRLNNTARNDVNATVVVFDRRAHLYAPAGSETVYVPYDTSKDVSFNLEATSVPGSSKVVFTGRIPPIQKGSWLLDATVTCLYGGAVFVPPNDPRSSPPTPDPNWPPQPHVRNAQFYRVVSATMDPTNTYMEVELEVPLRPDQGVGAIPIQVAHRRFVVLSGVAEVFELPDPVTAK